MEIGSEQLGDEVAADILVPVCREHLDCENVHVLEGRDKDVAQADNLQGWSVALLARGRGVSTEGVRGKTHVLVSEMLEQLQLAVGTFRENRSAEGLHDLLDSDRLAGQLVSRRAIGVAFRLAVGYLSRARWPSRARINDIPDQPEGTHAYRLQVRVSRIVNVSDRV